MKVNRRKFMGDIVKGGSVLMFPTIIPEKVLGAEAPSKKIQLGVIGCGRIAISMDFGGLLNNQDISVLYGFSDCDTLRMDAYETRAKRFLTQGSLPKLKKYQNYHDLLADPGIDAVMICTPDHTHAEISIAAALAGKDVYMQKPLAMTIEEGRLISDVFRKTGRIFHLGSQQRSEGPGSVGPQFRQAVEFVRDGRIGNVKRVEVGLPQDPQEDPNAPLRQEIPPTFDYDRWLGANPVAPYCELRTHWQGRGGSPVCYERPGWLTMKDYCLGMITGWGSHHVDIVQWGLGTEDSGPVRVEGRAEFPKRRLWDVHGKLDVQLAYANGTVMHIAGTDRYPCGVRFVGEKGWIFCSRESQPAIKGVPSAGGRHGRWRPLETSDNRLISGDVSPEIREKVLRNKLEHHRVWLEGVRTRKPTNISVEAAHRTTTACILAHLAYTLKRPLRWNPVRERFENDDEANRLIGRRERAPYGAKNEIKRAGFNLEGVSHA